MLIVDEQIEVLREKLNNMMDSNDVSKKELLRASEELDVLIVSSMREQQKEKQILPKEIANELDVLMDKLQIFKKIYQTIRLVDPIGKKVYDINNGKLLDTGAACHNIWNKDGICDNCVSMRALNENDSIFKLEIREGRIYLVTAVPFTISGKRFTIEMLKDASNSMLLGNSLGYEGEQALSTVEHMNRIAVMDTLTDLYNRRFMNERLLTDIINATIKKEPLSFIFTDIDFFKKVNDTFGHTAGDYVIREVSKEFKKHIRKKGYWAARYGGDEFFICLPNTEKEEAVLVADKIRKGIEGKKFDINKQIVSITCSFGVDSVNKDYENLTVEDVIKKVDKKLYTAKKCGRNMVVS